MSEALEREAVLAEAERVLRQNWVEGSRGGTPLQLHRAEPRPLPLAVVLGLLLRGDRLAPLRAAPAPGPSWRACWRRSGRTASSATRSSGAATSPGCGCSSTTSPRARAEQTETIQPPLLAWAWRIAVGDPAEEPRIAGTGRLARRATATSRATACSGSSSPTSPGLDASPKFEPVWGRRANGRIGFPLLVHRNRRLGWDARRIRDAGGPVLCEIAGQHLWSLSLQALGRPSATPALVERLWDERRGLFLDEAQPGGVAAATS